MTTQYKGQAKSWKNLEGEAHHNKWKITQRDNKTWTDKDIMYKTKTKQKESNKQKHLKGKTNDKINNKII